MVYCLCYGVNNRKAKGYFFVTPEVISSEATSEGLRHYLSGKVDRSDTAILVDVPFNIATLISKRILIEIGNNLYYKIRSLYV